jgi:hypothetical protein
MHLILYVQENLSPLLQKFKVEQPSIYLYNLPFPFPSLPMAFLYVNFPAIEELRCLIRRSSLALFRSLSLQASHWMGMVGTRREVETRKPVVPSWFTRTLHGRF